MALHSTVGLIPDARACAFNYQKQDCTNIGRAGHKASGFTVLEINHHWTKNLIASFQMVIPVCDDWLKPVMSLSEAMDVEAERGCYLAS